MHFVRRQFGRVWLLLFLLAGFNPLGAAERLRLIIETDAGGDPDDEQSLVRFLLYANEWDLEGIIANRPHARDGENKNSERTGLGIVRRQLKAYGECYPNLVQHDPRYPTLDHLWQRTVAGHDNTDDAVNLIITAVDRDDPRPIWYSDWGTDHGAATNNLRRALDQVLRERGREGYAGFKSRFRLSSADAFGEHTSGIEPPFPLWVDTWRPEMDGKRWYHRFSAITARAGGFDLARDCLTGHGPLGALYPTNTTHWQKEGDSLSFIYLIPTGLSDPNDPTLGGWGGRLGRHERFTGKSYYWANQLDAWNATTNRDNTLARWADAIQNDFKARLDWCVKPPGEANHPPVVKVNGGLTRTVRSGDTVPLDAIESSDPDRNRLRFEWFHYPEPGSYGGGRIEIRDSASAKASFVAPRVSSAQTAPVILAITDDGSPALTRYQRVVVSVGPSAGRSN
ncbi:MAG TPA: nucleoside hydrolase-like domain-containing protein [Verrucomicrobiae bacterium]|nr:nucleoside hydrolase-like domain-containing protein [Verrucomicrobiae bacterium]